MLPLSENAIHWAWRYLAQRAGFDISDPAKTGFEVTNVGIFYGEFETIPYNEMPGIFVKKCAIDATDELMKADINSLKWTKDLFPPGKHSEISLPLVFGAHQPLFEIARENQLIVHFDILAAVVFFLNRYEELITDERDEHGRFLAKNSVSFRQGFLHIPLVDYYVQALITWLEVLLPRWTPQPLNFRLQLSHDIDVPILFKNMSLTIRHAGIQLAKHHAWNNAVKIVRTGLNVQRGMPQMDPYYAGLSQLIQISEANDVKSAFYFMASPGGINDDGYNLNISPYRELIEQVKQRKHEIGFHPGYNTFQNMPRFLQELDRLKQASGVQYMGGRQHFLRFAVPDTWRLWEEAGLIYDSSLGYAEYEGFRCSTCHPYQPFDLQLDRAINLMERPLIVMDATLQRYRGLPSTTARDIIMQLAHQCAVVGGEMTLLWHNSSLYGKWDEWGKMYAGIIKELAVIA